MTPKTEFTCPKCKKKNRVKLIEIAEEDKIPKIISREIFNHKCKNCGETITLDHNLKVIGKNYIIYYTPTHSTPIEDSGKEYLRVCDTYDDLKEKILIFEDDLFDITIEFIKKFFERQLDKEKKKELIDIRYDGKDEEKLAFYLLGVKETIACPIDFYNKMFKKLKYKKITKCVMIDKDTFDKYYKMRLF